MGNSPRYVGFIDPPYIVTLTDDSGAALNLTGCTSNSFTLTMLNQNTGLSQQGVGVWTITDAVNGKASYQWTNADMATAGPWWIYTTAKLPAEPSPREFDPELILILPGTVGAGAAPAGIVPFIPLANPFTYLPVGWDTAWQLAKQHVGSQRVSVVGIGDSITEGQGSTDIMVDAWWPKLRSSLLAANGNKLGGDHYGLMYSAMHVNAWGTGSTATYPLLFYGTYNAGVAENPGGYNYLSIANNALAPYVDCNPPYSVVGFDIIYLDFVTSSWAWQIDNGSWTTVNTTGPGTAVGAIVKKVSISVSPGIHKLTVNAPLGGAAMDILGITAYASNTGICFANMGWPGMGLVSGTFVGDSLSDTANFPVDRLAIYQGYQGTTAAPTALSGFGFPSQPDLAIIALGVNDAAQSVSRASFRDALERLVWSLRYGKNDACSIIIVAMWQADGTLATSTTVANQDYTAAAPTAYRDIRAAMIEVARAEGCAFVDVHGAFGRTPATNGWITSASNIHPTPSGHLKIANMLSSIV